MAVMRTIDGFEFIIDDCDVSFVAAHRWGYQNGYIRMTYARGGERFLHRLLTGAGRWQIVDHIDRNPRNNSRNNLRIVKRSLSGHNRSMPTRALPRGVSYHHGKYQASIRIDTVLRYLGRYDTIAEASEAYILAALAHHGEYTP